MTSRNDAVQMDMPVAAATEIRRADILLLGMTPAEAETLPPRLFGVLAPGCVQIDYDALVQDGLGEAMAILSPLVGSGFDAVDVAHALARARFKGRYIAYADEIAYEPLIRAEVQATAPDLVFDTLAIGHGPRLAVI